MRSVSHLALLAGPKAVPVDLTRELAFDGFEVYPVDPSRLAADRLPPAFDVVLFVGLSQAGGLEALRALRAGIFAPHLPATSRCLWVCTTRTTTEVLRAFDTGADDVLRAPFVYAELLARVRALLARSRHESSPIVRCGALSIDTDQRRATYRARPLRLRPKEYELLLYLARSPERVCSKIELLGEVWGYRAAGSTRTIDAHACQVRLALQEAGAPRETIATVWGVGYRLIAQPPGLRVLPGGQDA